MGDKHISSQFDAELNSISTSVLEMGGLVESQLRQAIYALHHGNAEVADQVLGSERKVNRYEVEIDHNISSTIGRRQPTARDLRLLIAISKTTANLERAGDEAARIARLVKEMTQSGGTRSLPAATLKVATDLAINVLHNTLDAFARLDVDMAMKIIREDVDLDAEYEGFVRRLITYMMEDPRTISAGLNMLFMAKAIERIGDHAKNIAEATIYVVKGTDVRHTTLEEREQAVK